MFDAKNQKTTFPLFYSSMRPLDADEDSGKRLRATEYSFARGTNVIPLLHAELPLAAAYYPIMFSSSPQPTLTAVVGLSADTNLFVDNDGHWLPGSYLPAYVQRYPFLLLEDHDQNQYVLCIDENASLINDQDGELLFNNGKPSKFTKNIMNFCVSLQEIDKETDSFLLELQECHLLQEVDLQLTVSGSAFKITGMQTISPKKFDALPTGKIIEWHRKGWLACIYAQLLSTHRWQNIVQLHEENIGAISNTSQSTSQPTSNPKPSLPPVFPTLDGSEVVSQSGFRLIKRPGYGKEF